MAQLIGNRSQKEFAGWAGESPARVNNYLMGVSLPRIDFLIRLGELGVNLEWLLFGRGEMYRVDPAQRGEQVREQGPDYMAAGVSLSNDDLAMLKELHRVGIHELEELKKLTTGQYLAEAIERYIKETTTRKGGGRNG